MNSPCLSACRPLLFEPSCARCGIGPFLRLGDWVTPDHNGVTTFRIGKRRRVSWPLYTGSWALPQQSYTPLLTFAPARTCQPRSSPLVLRRFNQGFTCVQLDTDFPRIDFDCGYLFSFCFYCLLKTPQLPETPRQYGNRRLALAWSESWTSFLDFDT